VEISEATPVPEAKWPLWTWFAYPALAIAIGGGLGYGVAVVRQQEPTRPIHATAEPIVAAPQPTTPRTQVTPPSPEIEFDPVKTAGNGLAPRATPKPQAKSKPTKSTRCNVYDHMNGC
jgi:hypothetical protein